jgi:hypothetical protein
MENKLEDIGINPARMERHAFGLLVASFGPALLQASPQLLDQCSVFGRFLDSRLMSG